MELEPIVEKKTNATVKSHINRIIENKTKKSVEELLNAPSINDNLNEDDDFMTDDELEEISLDGFNDGAMKLGESRSRGAKNLSEDEILKRIEEKDKFDIFTDIGDHWQEKGQIVRYQIDKNNRMLTRVDHPFSWEDIQKKFGGGNYKVIAKLPALNNQYLKAQSKIIASAPDENPEFILKSLAEGKKDTTSTSGLNTMELLTVLEKKSELAELRAEETRREAEERIAKAEIKAREEARERLEAQEKMFERMMNQKSGSGDILEKLTPILTMVLPAILKKETPKDNSEVLFKIQEMNMKMMENMQKTNEKMFSSLQDSIKAMGEAVNAKKETGDFDAFKIMKMMKDSENEGFEKYRLMNELAKERAEELADLRGGGDGEDKKESTVDTLIKSFAPAIAQMVVGPTNGGNGGGVAVQPTVVPNRKPVVVAPVNRGSVSQPRTRTQEGTGRNSVSQTKTQSNEQVHQNGKTGVQSGVKNVLEAPKTANSFLSSEIDETVETVGISPTAIHQAVEPKDPANIEKIYGIIFPLAIASYTSGNATMHETCISCVNELEKEGVELSSVVRDFDDETLSAILSSIPEDYHQMIKDLQNGIVTEIKARIG
jgi:hypothetical protein